MVVDPTAAPVTVKIPVLAPPGIFTGDGCRVTMPPGLAARLIEAPLEGAGALSVTVPFTVFVSPTVCASNASDMLVTATFTSTRSGLYPVAEAKRDALPMTPVGVTCTVAVVPPGGIKMFGWTVATLVWVMVRFPAPKVVRLSGFGVSVMMVGAVAMVTVAGLLFVIPSLTINCTTNVPGRSTRNEGATPVLLERIALLPAGLLAKVHE